MQQLELQRTDRGSEQDDDLIHTCLPDDDDKAICGKDLTGREWVDDPPEDELCIVCESLVTVIYV